MDTTDAIRGLITLRSADIERRLDELRAEAQSLRILLRVARRRESALDDSVRTDSRRAAP